jgi:hypothetical protein
MRSANKEFTFRGPSKLLGFGNADDADIAGVTDGDLQAIQEVEEVMIADVKKVACVTEVNVGRAYAYPNHFVDDICTFGN